MANRLSARDAAAGSFDLAESAGMIRLNRDVPQAAAGGCPCGCGLSAQPGHQAAPTYVTDYTAMIVRNADGSTVSTTGTNGKSSFVSFSFETAVPEYSHGEYSKQALASVKPMTEAQKNLAREALAAWGQASGLTFFEVAEGQGDMKFIKLQVQYIDPTAAGFAVFPGGTYDGQPSTSDVYIDHESANWLQLYLHEIGHALGLKHPFEGDIRLDPSVDNYGATVMSYTPDADPKDQLGYLDHDAIRYLYGDNAQDGKHVAGWSWNAAKQTLTQYGFDTDETILGIGGDDVIHGNAGNDVLQGREGNDVLHGGEGNDTLLGGYGGGKGLDRLNGGNGDDLVEIRYGVGSRLAIDGGAGTDQISFWFQAKATFNYANWAKANTVTGVEKTVLSAAAGNLADRITGGALADTIWGGDGNDLLSGLAGSDSLNGGAGNDTLSGGDGDDSIWGGDGTDTITGGNGIDRLSGDAGRDTLDGGDADDLIWAGADADTLRGGAGKDYLEGQAGDDLIVGGEGADNIWGGDGIDTVSYAGEAKGVTVTINAAREVTPGEWEFLNGIENLTGTALADRLTGDAGANVLNGGGGGDRLNGSGGNDRLIGGAGLDLLTGGGGADRFAFDDGHSGATRTSADQILDFSRGEKDRIDLSAIDAVAFTAKDDAFRSIGSTAFSGAAGELRWTVARGVTFVEGDTNGDGKADFALLVTGDGLAAGDFVF